MSISMTSTVNTTDKIFATASTKDVTGKPTEDDITQVITQANAAQQLICQWKDEALDAIITDISEQVADLASYFAEKTVAETGIGHALHKRHKLSLVYNCVTQNLLGTKTQGRLDDNNSDTVVEYASPIGIIFAVVPMTNPIPNSLFKSLTAIKTRNALIVSFPRKATQIGIELITLIQNILVVHGAPKELIQVIPQPSDRDLVNQFMCHNSVDLVLATGGAELVKSAHRSGNPCLGVGPGNVPAWICSDADYSYAASVIVNSKAYDNGIICGSENNLIVDQGIYSDFSVELENNGAAILTRQEKLRALEIWFDKSGKLPRDILGKPAALLAEAADIKRAYPIKVCVILAEDSEFELLGREKLAPILSLFKTRGDEGLALVQRFLAHDGAGHSAAIHSTNSDTVNRFAETVPAGRLLLNTPATFGMMGVSTDLPLSFMLGSGTWGGNITTEAITWRHFVNIKRLAKHTSDVVV